MGVSGCGKSTIGSKLAKTLSLPFFDGDDFHPEENISKMSEGQPLNDEDRKAWLLALNAHANKHQKTGAVIACSALKEKYRNVLSKGLTTSPIWVYLQGDYQTILDRLQKREGHYMPAALLKSQFDTLEPPVKAIEVPITLDQDSIISEIQKKI